MIKSVKQALPITIRNFIGKLITRIRDRKNPKVIRTKIIRRIRKLIEKHNYAEAILIAQKMFTIEEVPIQTMEILSELYEADSQFDKAIDCSIRGFYLEDSNDILADRFHRLTGPFSNHELPNYPRPSHFSQDIIKQINNVDPANEVVTKELITLLAPWYQPIVFSESSKSETPYSFSSNWGGIQKWKSSIETLLPFPVRDKVVVDVGCASGLFTTQAAIEGASKSVGIEALGSSYLQCLLTKKLFAFKTNKALDNLEFYTARISDVDLSNWFPIDVLLALNVIYWIDFSSPLSRSRPDGLFRIHRFFRNLMRNVDWLIIQGDEAVFKDRSKKGHSIIGTGSLQIKDLLKEYDFVYRDERDEVRYSVIAENTLTKSERDINWTNISRDELLDYWGNHISNGPHHEFVELVMSNKYFRFKDTNLFSWFSHKRPLEDYFRQNKTNYYPEKKSEILMKMHQYLLIMNDKNFCDSFFEAPYVVKHRQQNFFVIQDGCFRIALLVAKGRSKLRVKLDYENNLQ